MPNNFEIKPCRPKLWITHKHVSLHLCIKVTCCSVTLTRKLAIWFLHEKSCHYVHLCKKTLKFYHAGQSFEPDMFLGTQIHILAQGNYYMPFPHFMVGINKTCQESSLNGILPITQNIHDLDLKVTVLWRWYSIKLWTIVQVT